MKTLFTFGCSYTEDYLDNRTDSCVKYKEFRGGSLPKTWPTLLANKLEYDLKNYGENASGNDLIFHSFCEHLNEIKKEDMVIIEWSYIHRYRWTIPNRTKWEKVGPGVISEEIISKNTHEEICANRTHPLYISDVYRFMNVINILSKTIGFEIFYWSVENSIIYNLPKEQRNDKRYILNETTNDNAFNEILIQSNYCRIKEETGGVVNDLHLGEMGHKVQADLFYKHIMSEEQIKSDRYLLSNKQTKKRII